MARRRVVGLAQALGVFPRARGGHHPTITALVPESFDTGPVPSPGMILASGHDVYLRRLLIRLVLPLTWRRFAGMKAARLLRFSVTETDSAWQILQALTVVEDPVVRAQALQHAFEEVHHASAFATVAAAACERPPDRPVPARVPIFQAGSQHRPLRSGVGCFFSSRLGFRPTARVRDIA